MPRTVTSRGGRRLALAFLAAATLHAILFALFATLATRAPLATLAPLSSDGRMLLIAHGNGNTARAEGGRLYPVFIEHEVAETAKGNTRTGTSPRDRTSERTPDVETAKSGERARTSESAGTDESANGPGSGGETAVSAGTGFAQGLSGTPGERNFVSWLDGAIRARLSYPRRARERNAEGTVLLALSVPADGSTCDASVAQSSGSEILDRAALDLVRSLFPAPVAPETPFSSTFSISFTLSQKR